MPKIEIYTTDVCPYCVRAKQLLKNKGMDWTEINIQREPERREEMMTRAEGRRTVPQIFINDRHVGGCDDLYALESAKKLDALLNA